MGRVILLAIFVLVTPAAAETAPVTQTATVSSDFSAQSRPRARFRVNPGRLLYRECSFKLVPEWRPSGTVIVPRQRCWWVRG
jgi:hypothetical protein